MRDIADFVDMRALRRFWRRPWQASVTLVSLAAVLAWLWYFVSGSDDSPLLFLAVVPLVVMPGLALGWLVISDIWRAVKGNRQRNWRKARDD